MLERDGYICHYCEMEMEHGSATVDHMWPRTLGGSNLLDNLVACCHTCNTLKGDLPYEEFMKIWEPPKEPGKIPPDVRKSLLKINLAAKRGGNG